MKDVSAIVLAAGSGTRFGGPKQFLELTPGVRLVDAAVDAAFRVTDNVILVLPEGHDWKGRPVQATVAGGSTRLASVAAGLRQLRDDQKVVIVHDSAHPLAPQQTFIRLVEAVRRGADAAVPLLSTADVVKRLEPTGILQTIGRDGLGLAQVPMGFSARALIEVHAVSEYEPGCWEDSMLVELSGGRVVATPGSAQNIHVVDEEDLVIARLLAMAGHE